MENTKDLEVPMPEPDGWLFVSHSETLNGVSEAPEERPAWQYTLRHMGGLKPYLTQRQYEAQSPAIQKWYEPVSSQREQAFTLTKMRTYGDIRAAAGYAWCLREMLDCRTCRNYTRDGCIQTAQCVDGNGYRRATPVRFWSATMRGEVK